MLGLLAPLWHRRVAVVVGTVFVLTLVALLVLAPRTLEGDRILSAVFLSAALGCIAGAVVLFVSVVRSPLPGLALAAEEPARQRALREMVLRGAPVDLAEPARGRARAFAEAYRDWLPRWTAPFLLLMTGVLLQALSQLRLWDGGVLSVLLVLEFLVAVVGFAVIVPLQLRRIERADRFVARSA